MTYADLTERILLVGGNGLSMLSSLYKKLFQHIDNHIAVSMKDWKSFYQQSSSFDKNKLLIDRLQNSGFITHFLDEEKLVLYGELFTGAQQSLLLCSYYDLQHLSGVPQPEDLIPLITGLAAIDTYRKNVGEIPINIKWLFVNRSLLHDPALSLLLNAHKEQLSADGCLWYEPELAQKEGMEKDTPLLAAGTKGLLCATLEVQTTREEIDAVHGGIVPNAAWRLLWALQNLKDAREEILIDGFYDTLIPAEDETVEHLYTMPDSAPSLARQWGMEEMLLGLKGFQLHYIHLLMPTCNINEIHAGNIQDCMHNPEMITIPGYARAQIDFYLVPRQDPDDIFAKLQRHLNIRGFRDIQVKMLSSRFPVYTPISHPFVQKVYQATSMAYEREVHLLPMTAGSYPLYPIKQALDIPVVISSIPFYPENHVSDIQLGNVCLRGRELAGKSKQIAMIMGELHHGNTTHSAS